MIGKLVCSCAGVGEGNIENKIKEGFTEMASLCKASGAGLGCGSCRPEVKLVLDKLTAAENISSETAITI